MMALPANHIEVQKNWAITMVGKIHRLLKPSRTKLLSIISTNLK